MENERFKVQKELKELGLQVENDMKVYRMKRLLNEYQKIKKSTNLVIEDIKQSVDNNPNAHFTYYKMDEFGICCKFFEGHYEMIFLPMENIAICNLVNEDTKEKAKKEKLYHGNIFAKSILFFESEFLTMLKENNLEIVEREDYKNNNETHAKSVRLIKQKINSKVRTRSINE